MELEWMNPPSRRSDTTEYEPIVELLKQNPGKWARIRKDWKTTSGPTGLRNSGCEVTTRRNADKKTWSVYARWPLTKAKATEQGAEAKPKAVAPPAPDTKEAVHQAIATGTALRPPAPALPKRQVPAEPAPANDFGIAKFRADRAARGARP
jgi:hypothetical protein